VMENIIASKLFADDFKAYNIDNYSLNVGSMQQALDRLIEWTSTWQLELSIPKCGSLLINPGRKRVDDVDLVVGDESLKALQSVLDLGETIDCKLTFSKHIKTIVGKAKQRIYLIFKAFVCRDIDLMVIA